MKTNPNSPPFEEVGDAALVSAALEGDRNAFGAIVSRYQRLLCSVAYSSLGNLSSSEDVAQEAFLEAWKKLSSLKEPEKLKAWLCGILRFKLSHFRRKESRQPIRNAEALEEAENFETEGASVEEAAMNEEEQALLWQALEKVPETYREPLVLYYREHRSVEHVAYELDLSEDAVKQRLSRGRKLLQERMMHFVEDALARSTPGRVFTAAVLAALPVSLAPPAKAAGFGAAAVHAGSWFKWASVAAFVASFSGIVSTVFALRASLDQARTRRERRKVVRVVIGFVGISLFFVGGLFGLRQLALNLYEYSGYFNWGAQAFAVAFALGFALLTRQLLSSQRTLRAAERIRRPDLFENDIDRVGSKKGEYLSRWTLLGLPLIHIKYAMSERGDGPAVGWIAAGDRAYGVLFAWGGYAYGLVSVGIVSVGVVTVGAVGIGLLSVGTVGFGLLAIGCSAIGYKAYGSLSALGWESAVGGGFALAKEGAIAPIAMGAEVNNEAASQLADLAGVNQSMTAVFVGISLLVIVPVVFYAKAVRQRMGKRSGE